jgi:uncharacterized membrane protein YfcA
MTISQWILLSAVGVASGFINSLAGGGSFLSLPALFLVGVSPLCANATSTLALLPGQIASSWVYREGLQRVPFRTTVTTCIISLIGGAVGAILLVRSGENTFVALIPYLTLGASLVFLFGGDFVRFFQRKTGFGNLPPAVALLCMTSLQFCFAIYGGYFGAANGILMLAMLSAFGFRDMLAMNGLKTLLASCLNCVAAIIFIALRLVDWYHMVPMILGAILGGFLGAFLGLNLSPRVLRAVVGCFGIALSIYFFRFRPG